MESQEPASRSMGQPEKGDVWNFHLRKNGDVDDVGDDGDVMMMMVVVMMMVMMMVMIVMMTMMMMVTSLSD